MGKNKTFARDFPQDAPCGSNSNALKGKRATRMGSIIKVHGSRKIREVSGLGGRCKVVDIFRCDYHEKAVFFMAKTPPEVRRRFREEEK